MSQQGFIVELYKSLVSAETRNHKIFTQALKLIKIYVYSDL